MTQSIKRIEYPVKSLRVSEETWKELKKLRKENNMSWEKFIKQMIELYGDKNL